MAAEVVGQKVRLGRAVRPVSRTEDKSYSAIQVLGVKTTDV